MSDDLIEAELKKVLCITELETNASGSQIRTTNAPDNNRKNVEDRMSREVFGGSGAVGMPPKTQASRETASSSRGDLPPPSQPGRDDANASKRRNRRKKKSSNAESLDVATAGTSYRVRSTDVDESGAPQRGGTSRAHPAPSFPFSTFVDGNTKPANGPGGGAKDKQVLLGGSGPSSSSLPTRRTVAAPPVVAAVPRPPKATDVTETRPGDPSGRKDPTNICPSATSGSASVKGVPASAPVKSVPLSSSTTTSGVKASSNRDKDVSPTTAVSRKIPTSSAPPPPAVNKSAVNDDKNSDQDVEKELELNYVFPLKKKSARFPNAKYFCRLCEYHCDNVNHCNKHIKETRHERLLLAKTEEELLQNILPPDARHAEAVTQAVNRLFNDVAPTESDMKRRYAAFEKLQDVVKRFPTASVRIYGSTVSGFALKDSDLNIDLVDPNPAQLLKGLYETLKNDKTGYFAHVLSDFHSKMPGIYAIVPSTGLKIQVAVNNGVCIQTSDLLAVYCRLDDRVRPLAIALRHWAKMCRIDNQSEGTLPAYVFGLMTVYFLQQCEPPVLPVLHELLNPNEQTNGVDYLADVEKAKTRWCTANVESTGSLWIAMLRFYCLGLDTTEAVISIRQGRVLKRTEKKWTSKKLAIEDPFSQKRNIARSLSHSQIYEYIDERLRSTYKYFGIAPTSENQEFSFDDRVLVPKKGPALICSICQRDGHLKVDCPEEYLPELPRLPPLNWQYLNILNRILYQVLDDFCPRERELRQRKNVLAEMESIVKSIYPAAKLGLFGSSCNGFGFQHSDLDISLVFVDHKTSEVAAARRRK